MLKNKTERLEYFSDQTHWHVWKANETYATSIIRVCKLDGYPIIRISANVDINGIHECTLGYYELSTFVNTDLDAIQCVPFLRHIYNLTLNQCIDVMTKFDKGVQECLSH